MRDINDTLLAQAYKIAPTGSWVWLAQVALDSVTTYYLTDNAEDLTYNGQKWRSFPFQVGEERIAGDGNLSELKLTVDNTTREIGRIIETYNGLEDATVTLKAYNTEAKLALDAGVYEVQACSVSTSSATLTLGAESLYQQEIPARRGLRRCTHVYKGSLCGYVGTLASCDKTLDGPNGCRKHGDDEITNALTVIHPKRFGGFPGVQYK